MTGSLERRKWRCGVLHFGDRCLKPLDAFPFRNGCREACGKACGNIAASLHTAAAKSNFAVTFS